MCLLQELCIVNGRIGSDKNKGNFTFDYASTIDYVICTPDLLPHLTNFKVDTLCDVLSDKHNPITVNLNLDCQMHQNNITHAHNSSTNNTTNENKVKCKWENSKKVDYPKNFDMHKILNISANLHSVNVMEATQDMIDNL